MGQEEKKAEVVTEYLRGGVTLREMERKYGISSSTIHRWVKEYEGAVGPEDEAKGRKAWRGMVARDAELSAKALRMALRNNPERKGLIHHSDRGLQYYSSQYTKLLGKHIRISMSEKSDPLENAIAERVNGILKQELLAKSFSSLSEAKRQVELAVNIYNNLRPHLSIDMLTPAEAHAQTGPLTRRWKNYFSTNTFVSQASA